jgi:hypothetical protein
MQDIPFAIIIGSIIIAISIYNIILLWIDSVRMDKILKIKEIYDKGLISESEYSAILNYNKKKLFKSHGI